MRHTMIRILIAATAPAALIVGAAAWFLWAMPVHAAECRPMKVSFYCCEHHGRKTASGAVFNENALTAAMPSRSHLGEVWKVYHGKKSVTVKITDTGAFAKYGRGMDLSRGAFAKLASTGKGVIPVKACRVG